VCGCNRREKIRCLADSSGTGGTKTPGVQDDASCITGFNCHAETGTLAAMTALGVSSHRDWPDIAAAGRSVVLDMTRTDWNDVSSRLCAVIAEHDRLEGGAAVSRPTEPAKRHAPAVAGGYGDFLDAATARR